ncbi:hypothetical protein V8C42DRAFT_163763 [Trichoderma barbatum]
MVLTFSLYKHVPMASHGRASTPEIEGLDHERCAALHNLIIEQGWTASGRNLSDLDCRSWWECYDGGTRNCRYILRN